MDTKGPLPDIEDLEPKYKDFIQEYQPFVLCPEENLENIDESFYGKEIHHVDSYSPEGGELTDLLLEMDAQAYDGLSIENWVSVDACQETCGILGFGTFEPGNPAVESLEIPSGYDDILPVSEFSGAYKSGDGLVVNTFSVGEKNQGFGAPTAALGAEALSADDWYAIAQFDNPSPMVYSKLGEMKLVETPVPGHSKPESSFKFHVSPETESVAAMLEGETSDVEPDIVVGKDDEALLQELQGTNSNYLVVPPGSVKQDGEFKLALKEVKET